ncbi:MAG TPA: anthranilate synthase component I [Clostridia bacterium]|nr:anthranilate synthase component I [Clostridia bacterium]
MYYPDLESVKHLAKNYNIIPVSCEIYADMETPISIFRRFEKSGFCFLLESVEGGEKWGRFSFIGRNPFLTLKGSGRRTELTYRSGKSEIADSNPFETMKELMAKYRGAPVKNLPRFNGGAVGFFGYDIARYFERLPDIPADDLGIPEVHFMFADEVIAFDHFRHKLHIIVNLHTDDGSVERGYNTVISRINAIREELREAGRMLTDDVMPASGLSGGDRKIDSNVSREQFCENVDKAKEYIRNGDIFQVVLSQRLRIRTSCSPLNVYRALRTINPGPYMYYLKFDGYTLAGSSPEMLVRVDGRRVETCPIAGTRKRGGTEAEDERLERELLSDEKERAEHIMLVDLGRNDIGKVSEFGSVKVDSLMHIERFSHVMHIVSNVSGILREGVTSFDALSAVLPAGTLSGAPKIRAMEIIDELETVKRCQYGGAVGYLSFDGNLDSCITIRTVLFKDGFAYVQAGGGIVADSKPELEYEESMNKAMALIKAVEEGEKIR